MGERGEGWVVGQFILGGLILVSPPSRLLVQHGWLRGLGVLLIAIGGVIGLLSLANLGRNLTPFPKPIEDGELVKSGLYGVVRHPIYLSALLGAFGWVFWRRSLLGLLFSLLLFLFFDAKARHEERWLRDKYPAYAAYQERVKKLIPWVY
ncbi:MAG: isoprenylcysteine carboxylmethyltransferase family protein [Chloroflexota bacterium]|nr:isoprenylcysteine carboxylmethyltransferase family protein [Chloroflexota bacterium]